MNDKVKLILRSFVIRSIILFVGWMIVYHGLILPDGRTNKWLTTKVVQATKFGLSQMAYDTSYEWNTKVDDQSSRYIFIDNEPVVLVADACNGLELMALFIGFLICFPGPAFYKILVIPIGTISVFLINVIREIILALNYKYFQETFEFNHKYTYVFFVYAVIFLIWRFWLNRYSDIGTKVKKP